MPAIPAAEEAKDRLRMNVRLFADKGGG